MRRTGHTATFGLAAAGLIVLIGAVLLLLFRGQPAAIAIGLSAAVALPVQLAAFTILRKRRGQGVLIGWGLGSLLRVATLAVFGFVAVGALGLPATPALLSLASFLFATMILEPILLES